MYIAALETLFSKDGSELSHKVAERVAFYLGGIKNEKMYTYRKVKGAYDVRSKYIHGSKLDKKHSTTEKLIDLSKRNR